MLAANPFFTVAGKHTATIRAKLTSAGRRLLKRGSSVRALMRVTSIGVTGATGTRTVSVTPRRK